MISQTKCVRPTRSLALFLRSLSLSIAKLEHTLLTSNTGVAACSANALIAAAGSVVRALAVATDLHRDGGRDAEAAAVVAKDTNVVGSGSWIASNNQRLTSSGSVGQVEFELRGELATSDVLHQAPCQHDALISIDACSIRKHLQITTQRPHTTSTSHWVGGASTS
jgi:hypothetical protein